MSPVLPGATIGILGGGQLGRMTAMAARSLGYRIQVMDPDPSCPARFVVDACFEGSWDDVRAAADLARGCDVVTLEIEQISIPALEAAGRYAPVRPSARVLEMVQDRLRQKTWLCENGFPVGPHRAVHSPADLRDALVSLGGRIYLKRTYGGYDGRGQIKVDAKADLAAGPERVAQAASTAWAALGGAPCVAEQALDLDREISVMAARSPGGEVRAFPAATNHHENQILVWSVLPSSIPGQLESRAHEIAVAMAEKLQLEGLLAVEMFVTRGGDLFVNELAPRPHNSYHASQRACVTSQFEQAVRAVCDLPLGNVEIVRPGAIANLLGDLWLGAPPRFDRALRVPEVRVHLYEKHTPRPGRKMGHLSATAPTPEEAVARVLEAKSLL
jgi:5-(carboxyamino)imidazole ribonucleotide synthase